MRGALQFVRECFRTVYRPPRDCGMAEWNEENITLRSEESLDASGPYHSARSPLVPMIFDLFFGSRVWRKCVIKKGSQSGVSLHAQTKIARTVDEAPRNVIYAIDSETNARSVSVRLQAILEDCKATAAKWARAAGNCSQLFYRLPGMKMWFIGSHSVGAFAEKSAWLLIADELDKHAKPKKEASTIDLLEQRGKQVEDYKLLAFSTPTEEGEPTDEEYQKGTQTKAFVPCPFCEEKQVLEREGLEYQHCKREDGTFDLERVLLETGYRCAHCEEVIPEDRKSWMVTPERVELRHTNFDEEGRPAWEPGVLSVELPDLYSVLPTSTWGHIAVEWITSEHDPKKRQNVLNGRLALARPKREIKVETSDLVKLQKGYRRGTLPFVPVIVVLYADSQGSYQKWVMSGFTANGSQWVADWGMTTHYQELIDKVAKEGIRCGAGRVIRPQRIFVDEGGKGGTSYEVRQFALRNPGLVVPTKGRGGAQVKDTVWISESKVAAGGDITVPVVHFDDDAFKRLVYESRIKNYEPGREERTGEPILALPGDTDENFRKELSAEHLERVRLPDGSEGQKWIVTPPNDWGDGVKGCEVSWNVLSGEIPGLGG